MVRAPSVCLIIARKEHRDVHKGVDEYRTVVNLGSKFVGSCLNAAAAANLGERRRRRCCKFCKFCSAFNTGDIAPRSAIRDFREVKTDAPEESEGTAESKPPPSKERTLTNCVCLSVSVCCLLLVLVVNVKKGVAVSGRDPNQWVPLALGATHYAIRID